VLQCLSHFLDFISHFLDFITHYSDSAICATVTQSFYYSDSIIF
jgi:hypothetical protein